MNDWPHDPSEIAKLESDLLIYSGPDRIVGSQEKLNEIKRHPRNEVSIKSRYPRLDALIDGFRGGELIILSGPTKHGKTLCAKTLSRNFLLDDIASVWFS